MSITEKTGELSILVPKENLNFYLEVHRIMRACTMPPSPDESTIEQIRTVMTCVERMDKENKLEFGAAGEIFRILTRKFIAQEVAMSGFIRSLWQGKRNNPADDFLIKALVFDVKARSKHGRAHYGVICQFLQDRGIDLFSIKRKEKGDEETGDADWIRTRHRDLKSDDGDFGVFAATCMVLHPKIERLSKALKRPTYWAHLFDNCVGVGPYGPFRK
jgi:hypothetical protein